ncbi:MAG TPA: heavy metal translocating P-type ATPase [Nitrospirota bacterium]|nr:heavy metal translocating P-type ATPase [Nitrospirota bacterium]
MLEMAERNAVYDSIGGQRKVFCCHGCNGIYRLIHGEGLDDFYARRQEWRPGPPDVKTVDRSAFHEGLRPVGNEIETDIIVDGIRCASCVWLNEKILQRTEGVSIANVNYATHRARIRWDPAKVDIGFILSRITSIGYTPKPFHAGAWEDEQSRQSRDLLLRFGTAAFFSMQLMLFSIALYAGYFQGIDERMKSIFHVISFALTTPVLFYSGWPIIRGSIHGLRNLSLNMDVLIAAGALSAYGYSAFHMLSGEVYFDTAAMIITLILLGRYIEAGARRRASETIARLMQLGPKEARKLAMPPSRDPSGNGFFGAIRKMVAVSSLRPGDLLEVVPGEKIPADGIVLTGASEADESMLTGESRPSPKIEGSQVFGGTLNLYGSFVFRALKTGRETVLAQIVRAVEDAQARRAPIQSVADRVVGYFVPAIMVIALMTFTGWIFHGASPSRALMNAVSVMVIACPCALGLATPLAILISTSHGASRGILMKGGDVIEKTASVDFAVLDKTGTVTEGKPALTGVFGVRMTLNEALGLAASLERKSEHSLGKAIAGAARDVVLYEVVDFSAVPGKGVRGTIRGKSALIGSREYIEAEGLGRSLDPLLGPDQWTELSRSERSGATVVFLSYDGQLCGVFVISDTVREEALEAVGMLKKAGIGVSLVTGDNPATAGAVAAATGIGSVKARVSPLRKAEEIERLEKEGRRVLMAGDGVNDAPALVRATVGVAMGRATDIALESADIVVMRPDLRLVPDAVALAKKTFRIIRQNIFWAFFYNIVAVPLAIAGVLHPIMAAGAMAFSSLTVVGNSLRARLR